MRKGSTFSFGLRFDSLYVLCRPQDSHYGVACFFFIFDVLTLK